MRWRKSVGVAVLLAVLVGVVPAPAQAGTGSDLGWGLASVGSNIFYMPAKIVYAVIGGVTGCLAYVLTVGDKDVAETVWSPSLGGTYVLTPTMLRGEEPIFFFGESKQSKS
jgi:hypothetical protein